MFEGESDESPDWEAGDVILRIRSRKNKGGWRRKESSLYWRETIGVDEVRTLQVPVFRTDLSFLFTGLTRFRPQFDPFRWTRSETSTEGCYSTRYVIKRSPFSYLKRRHSGFVQTIEGEGMPHFEKPTYGDLYVEYNVVLPIEISPQTRRSECFYSLHYLQLTCA